MHQSCSTVGSIMGPLLHLAVRQRIDELEMRFSDYEDFGVDLPAGHLWDAWTRLQVKSIHWKISWIPFDVLDSAAHCVDSNRRSGRMFARALLDMVPSDARAAFVTHGLPSDLYHDRSASFPVVISRVPRVWGDVKATFLLPDGCLVRVQRDCVVDVGTQKGDTSAYKPPASIESFRLTVTGGVYNEMSWQRLSSLLPFLLPRSLRALDVSIRDSPLDDDAVFGGLLRTFTSLELLSLRYTRLTSIDALLEAYADTLCADPRVLLIHDVSDSLTPLFNALADPTSAISSSLEELSVAYCPEYLCVIESMLQQNYKLQYLHLLMMHAARATVERVDAMLRTYHQVILPNTYRKPTNIELRSRLAFLSVSNNALDRFILSQILAFATQPVARAIFIQRHEYDDSSDYMSSDLSSDSGSDEDFNFDEDEQ